MPTLINLPRRWSSRASQSLLGGLSSQVGGLSAMGAAQVTGNLLIQLPFEYWTRYLTWARAARGRRHYRHDYRPAYDLERRVAGWNCADPNLPQFLA